MKREEAIKRIQDHMDLHRIGDYPHIKLREALNMAISALREQEERRWIPVKERLPEYGQEVLVYTGNILKPIVMEYTFWKKDYDTWRHVTHWMPLPEPPKEVE